MKVEINASNVGSFYDGFSGVSLGAVNETIVKSLTKSEFNRYTRAIQKVPYGQPLNRKDLDVLDKIDATTYKHHGMCLKDSLVTKARLQASKKFGMQFIDRDGLVDHMNMMLSADILQKKQPDLSMDLAVIFIERFGDDLPIKTLSIVHKLNTQQNFDLADLEFISEMEALASEEMGLSIVDEALWLLIDKSCKKLGIYFQNLKQPIFH